MSRAPNWERANKRQLVGDRKVKPVLTFQSDPEWWRYWRVNKKQLARDGYRVRKINGEWIVTRWE